MPSVLTGIPRANRRYLCYHLRVFSPTWIARATLVVVVTLGGLLLGCATSPAAPGTDADHNATVQALLPTAEPTDPPTATTTPIPTAAPTDTPRPQPTYTPRPAPTQEGDGERRAAIPFQAELLDGTEIALADTFGTPTLLAFWAPW